MKKQDLIDFENEIAEIYATGVIKGPIHLRDGNEDQLIEIFKDIKSDDYVFATWANHLEALLKGIPREKVKARILEGQSMAMNFSQYKFYTSAIVGGICPIATGVALGLKKQNKSNRVYCFVGDMGVQTGIAHESIKYSICNDLPITWIIADNSKSVDTPTVKSWGPFGIFTYEYLTALMETCDYSCDNTKIKLFQFTSKYPHSGTGVFLAF